MPTPRVSIDDLPAKATPETDDLVVIQDSGITKRTTVGGILALDSGGLTAHLDDTLDAHDASAISAAPSSLTIDGVDVQTQLEQLALAIGTTGGVDTTAWHRWEGTQEEYDALGEYADDTIYAIFTEITPPPLVVPVAPVITAVAGDQTATISWPSVPTATSYTVERSTLPSTGFVTVGTVTSSPLLNGPLTNGTTYYYRVHATNTVGAGPLSLVVAVTPDTVHPSTPSAPTNMAAQAGDASVTINWLAPVSDGNSPITGYQVEVSTLPGGAAGPFIVLTTVSASTFSYLHTARTNGTTYWYQVRAINAIGNSVASTVVLAVPTAGATVPGVPLSVAAIPGVISATINWAAPASNGGSTITSYNVERSLSSSSGFTVIATVPGSILTVNATALTAGTTYYFRVVALNILGAGPASTSVSVLPTASATVPALWQDAVDTMDLAIVTAWYDANTGYDTEGFTSADLWIPAANSGVPMDETITSAWLTANTGTHVVFSGGRWTVTGLHAISINIKVNNVTVSHCLCEKPVGSGSISGGIGQDGEGGIVGGIADHCTLKGNFEGTGLSTGDATYYYNPADQTPDRWTMRYCDVSGYRAGYLAFWGCTAEYNWTHDLYIFDEAHNTAASIRGQNCRFYRCYLGDGTSGALSLYAENTPYTGITIQENVFAVNGHATSEINFPFKAGAYMDAQYGETRKLIGNYFVQGGSGDNKYFTEIHNNKLLSTGEHLFMDNGGTPVATEPFMWKYRIPDFFDRTIETITYEFTPTPNSTLFVMIGCQNSNHTVAQSPTVTAVGQYVSGQTFTKIMESANPDPTDTYGVKYWLYKAETGATTGFQHILVDPYVGTTNLGYFTTWAYEVTGRTGMTLAHSSSTRGAGTFGLWIDSLTTAAFSGAATTGRLCMAFVACSAFAPGAPGPVTGWTQFGQQPYIFSPHGVVTPDDTPTITGCAYWRKNFTGTFITIPDLGNHVANVGCFLTEWT